MLLAQHGLAPSLLARFKNGLLYCFIRGHVTSPADLIKPPVWRGVARRLGQWHASLPITNSNEGNETPAPIEPSSDGCCDLAKSDETSKAQSENNITPIRPRRAGPNMWTVLQKWILALPVSTEEQRLRQKALQTELERIVDDLDDARGIGDGGVCRQILPLSNPFLETKDSTELYKELTILLVVGFCALRLT